MWRATAVLLVLTALPGAARAGDAPAPAPVPQRAQAVAWADRDVQAVAPDRQHFSRYLWFSEEAQDLDADRRALSFHLNSLSREPEIAPLYTDAYQVPGTGGRLVKIDLDDFGIDPAVWERLADVDPYFHVQLVEEEDEYAEQEYGHYYDQLGQVVSKGTYGATWKTTRTARERTGKKITRKRAAFSGVLSETPEAKACLASLVSLTGSQAPVVSGPWFVYQTAIALDRRPAYHDFLGFKDQQTFEDLIGFDARVLKKFPIELADAVRLSDVAKDRKPRAVRRFGKVGGGYWLTDDVEVPADQSNPLRVFDPGKNLKVTAREVLGHLPNGLLAAGLFNDKGERQDVAPQGIAFDRWGVELDNNVHEGTLSCNRCHSLHSGKDGLADIKAWVRGHLNRPPLELRLTAHDDEERVRLRRLYLRNLPADLAADRQLVAQATLEATGWDSKRAVGALADLWERYNAPVDAERAARDVGLSKADFLERLRKFTRAKGDLDPVLTAYLRPEAVRQGRQVLEETYLEDDGPLSLQVAVWHELLPVADLAVRNLTVADEVKVKVHR